MNDFLPGTSINNHLKIFPQIGDVNSCLLFDNLNLSSLLKFINHFLKTTMKMIYLRLLDIKSPERRRNLLRNSIWQKTFGSQFECLLFHDCTLTAWKIVVQIDVISFSFVIFQCQTWASARNNLFNAF